MPRDALAAALARSRAARPVRGAPVAADGRVTAAALVRKLVRGRGRRRARGGASDAAPATASTLGAEPVARRPRDARRLRAGANGRDVASTLAAALGDAATGAESARLDVARARRTCRGAPARGARSVVHARRRRRASPRARRPTSARGARPLRRAPARPGEGESRVLDARPDGACPAALAGLAQAAHELAEAGSARPARGVGGGRHRTSTRTWQHRRGPGRSRRARKGTLGAAYRPDGRRGRLPRLVAGGCLRTQGRRAADAQRRRRRRAAASRPGEAPAPRRVAAGRTAGAAMDATCRHAARARRATLGRRDWTPRRTRGTARSAPWRAALGGGVDRLGASAGRAWRPWAHGTLAVDDRPAPRLLQPPARRGRPRDRGGPRRELDRQQRTLEMIASENFVPQAVLEARAAC